MLKHLLAARCSWAFDVKTASASAAPISARVFAIQQYPRRDPRNAVDDECRRHHR